jgi:hypothetical protein
MCSQQSDELAAAVLLLRKADLTRSADQANSLDSRAATFRAGDGSSLILLTWVIPVEDFRLEPLTAHLALENLDNH